VETKHLTGAPTQVELEVRENFRVVNKISRLQKVQKSYKKKEKNQLVDG
jgi:hypothetical protein